MKHTFILSFLQLKQPFLDRLVLGFVTRVLDPLGFFGGMNIGVQDGNNEPAFSENLSHGSTNLRLYINIFGTAVCYYIIGEVGALGRKTFEYNHLGDSIANAVRKVNKIEFDSI